MSAFSYVAIDRAGKRQKGVIEADSERHVRSLLRQQQLLPVTLRKVEERIDGSVSRWQRGVSKSWRRIRAKDLALLTRQLATLLNAGIPLDEALTSIAEQSEKFHIQTIIMAVRSKVLEGQTLAASLAQFPRSFSRLYTTTVASGEHSGKLDVVLDKLAEHIDKQHRMTQKVQQAMLYPLIMTMVSLLVVVFLLTNVVPKIVTVFTETQQVLPLATRILLAISHILAADGWLIVLLLIAMVYVIFRLFKLEHWRLRWHQFLLRLPLIKKLITLINCARFSRTLSMLLTSGVPVLDAMRSASQLVRPLPMQAAIKVAIEATREGSLIHKALKKTGYFPPLMLHLIASGEASGQLESMLIKSSNDLDADVEYQLQAMLTLFEPVLILIMGGLVLFIVLAIMLPIFALDQMPGNVL